MPEHQRLLDELSRAKLHLQDLRRELERLEGIDGESSGVRLLTCTVGELTVAFPLPEVLEVVLRPTLSPIPDVPEAVLGLMNLRGTQLPVIDVGCRLTGKASPVRSSDLVVVSDCAGRLAGLLVQDAAAAWTLAHDELRPISEDCSFSQFVWAMVTVQDRLGYLLSVASLTAFAPESQQTP